MMTAMRIVRRCLRRPLNLWARARNRLRLVWLRADRRILIGAGSQLHPSVELDLTWGGTIELGRKVNICQGAILAPFGGKITLGDGVYVGPYCVVYGHGGLTVGTNTMIAAHSVIIPANHRFDRLDLPIYAQPVVGTGIDIGEDCWIASGVRVLDDVRIGKGCVIGAGAVVAKSLPEYSIALGVPARVVRTRTPKESAEQALAAVGERPQLFSVQA